MVARRLRWYLAGAATARAGDEMSGPAVLLLGFALTGAPAEGSALLASLTIAAATGGLLFGALLDRGRRPERLLAGTLAAYALGILALPFLVGRVPLAFVVPVALAAGLFSPAVAGGWTSQLPRTVSGPGLPRASAIDALTFSTASLAGPALAAVTSAWLGARAAVGISAGLVAIAAPAALSLAAPRPDPTTLPATTLPATPPAYRPPGLLRQLADGFTAIWNRRALRRATVTSGVSYLGIGMLLVCCPVIGKQRLGGSAHGALLISAMAAASSPRTPCSLVVPGMATPTGGSSSARSCSEPVWPRLPSPRAGSPCSRSRPAGPAEDSTKTPC